MILQILTLFGATGMFLYGMNMMSAGLQKSAGKKLKGILAAMTSNPLKRVLTGVGVTAVIQSSSATTVMIVSFVNAGLMTLTQAVGVIMGANVGTTVTAWLISLFGLKMDISILSIPLVAVGFPCVMSKKNKVKNIGEAIIGFSLLFLGLTFMKESVPDLQSSPEIFSFIGRWTGYGFGSVLIFLLFGTVLTLVLQSSSATVALTLIILNLGWIPFDMAAAMVLGENIGTTITANIAASVANVSAKRAARAHTLFNLFGVIWALALFRPFLAFIGKIITLAGYPDPAEIVFTGAGPESVEATAALYGISMLHTLFNLVNTCILIWFTPLIVKAVTWMVKSPEEAEEDNFTLRYINTGYLETGELALEQAMNEIIGFTEMFRKEIDYIRLAMREDAPDKFEQICSKLVKYEEISNRMECDMAAFLNSLSLGKLSEESKSRITAMYKIIGEFESIGDSGEAISRILSMKKIRNRELSGESIARIDKMIDMVERACEIMTANLKRGFGHVGTLDEAYAAERDIDMMRNVFKEEEIKSIEQNAVNYETGICYMDIIGQLEQMGDFMMNVSEAIYGSGK